jgi:hypothetical protein
MRIRYFWALVVVPLALAACEDRSNYVADVEAIHYEISEEASGELHFSESATDAASVYGPNAIAGVETVDDSAPADPAENFMAYSYQMALEAPAEHVGGLFEMHQAACDAAGSNVCQIISANVSNRRADSVNARLEIRATPDWLASFRQDIESDARDSGGRIVSETTSAQDLSANILDLRARLAAQTALRDRLQNLLENEGASVEELVNVERELARVQGVIESAASRLRYLERRVSMSQLAIQYTSTAVPIRRSTMNPVASAFNDFIGIAAEGLGAVIRTIAAILPWLILIIPLVWYLRRLWRRRSARKNQEKGQA